jgi:hypothetical protein
MGKGLSYPRDTRYDPIDELLCRYGVAWHCNAYLRLLKDALDDRGVPGQWARLRYSTLRFTLFGQ